MTKDVDLVFRARDETTRTVEAITGTLHRFLGVQDDLGASGTKVNNKLSGLLSTFKALNDRVTELTGLRATVTSLDNLGRASERTAADVDKTEAKIANLKKRLDELNAADKPNVRSVSATQKQIEAATKALEEQRAALIKVRDEYAQVQQAAQGAGAKLGVADVTKPAVNEALSATRGDQNLIRDSVREMGNLIDAATRLRAEVDPLAAATDKYNQQLAEAKALFREGIIGDDLLAKSEAAYRQELTLTTKAIEDKISARNKAVALATPEGRDAAAQEKAAAEAAEQAAKAQEEQARAAAHLRAEIDPLGHVQALMNAELEKAKALMAAGAITAEELAAKEDLLAKQAKKASDAIHASNKAENGSGLFGLRPYELNSLSFQINDVITQLASGTPVMQVLAQQGGQIFQVFQRQIGGALEGVMANLTVMGPLILAAAAALGILYNALKNVGDAAKTFNEFNAKFLASADEGLYDPKMIADTAHRLDVLAGSLADARKELEVFTKAGIDPGRLESFGLVAQQVAKVTGKDIPTAAKLMADGFTGGYDAIKKLDDELNFLSPKQRKAIKDMYEQGRGAEAAGQAFDILTDKYDKAGKSLDNNWTVAMKNFAVAWDNFIGIISNSQPIQDAIKMLGDLGAALAKVTSGVPGVADVAAGGDATAQIAGIQARIAALNKKIEDLNNFGHPDALNLNDFAPKAFNKALGGFVSGSLGFRPGGGLLNGVDAASQIELKTDKQLAQEAAQEILQLQQQLVKIATSSSTTIKGITAEQLKVRQEVLDSLSDEALAQQLNSKSVTDAQKIKIAGELEYRRAAKETTDQVILNARRQAAEQAEIRKQADAVDYTSLAKRIVGAESSGNATAKNPLSSATGLGQFVEDTWLELFKKYFPTRAANMTESQILDLRKDADESQKMVELYIRENAKSLKAAGVAINDTNLYLAHFLGPAGATAILKAAPNAAASSVLSASAVKANPTVLKGKTASQVIDYAAGRVGASQDQRDALDVQAEGVIAYKKKLDDLNDSLDAQIQKWKDEEAAMASAGDVAKLTAQQLFDRNKAAFVAGQVADQQKKFDAANIPLVAERIQQIKNEAGAYYDVAHAQELKNAKDKEARDAVSDVLGLEQQRRQALQELNDQLNSGNPDVERVGELRSQIADLALKIKSAIPDALALAKALGDEKLVAAIEKAARSVEKFKEAIPHSAEITGDLINDTSDAIDTFVEKVSEGEKVFKSLGEAVRSFAADFLLQMAKIIEQRALQKIFGVKTDGSGTSSAGDVIGGILGGITGDTKPATTATAPSDGAKQTLTSWASNLFNDVFKTGGNLFSKIGSGIGSFFTSIFSLFKGGTGAGGGGAGWLSTAANFFASIFHEGGVAGGPAPSRAVNPAWFSNAVRYHQGGIAGRMPGLKQGEVAAILREGEPVLPSMDALRGIAGSGAKAPNIKIINALDSGTLVSEGLNTDVGEEAHFNFIGRNSQKIKGLLGV